MPFFPGRVSARALAVDWRFEPAGLYIGTGVGVYASTDGGVDWIKDGLDLPNVNIGDLAIDPQQDTITVGTTTPGNVAVRPARGRCAGRFRQ